MARKCLLVLLLSVLFVGPVLAQTPSTPVPAPASGVHYGLPHARVRVAILSRISPADRKLLVHDWLLSVRQKLLMSWRPLVPETARPPLAQAGTAILIVRLGPNGVVGHVRVSQSTKNEALVTGAEGALRSASPYPPFPPGVKARGLRLRVTFLYD